MQRLKAHMCEKVSCRNCLAKKYFSKEILGELDARYSSSRNIMFTRNVNVLDNSKKKKIFTFG